MKIGYMRVSTQEQRPDRQIDGLQNRCDRIYFEALSAVSRSRPVYESVIEKLQPGDTLVVWDLDRAFRSVIDALTQADRLRQNGVAFEIINLQVDTATPSGMLIYTVMSAFAEFERRILIQRTREGIEAARRRGRRLGRPPKLDRGQLLWARERLSSTGETVTGVAGQLGVAPWTLTRALRRAEFPAVNEGRGHPPPLARPASNPRRPVLAKVVTGRHKVPGPPANDCRPEG